MTSTSEDQISFHSTTIPPSILPDNSNKTDTAKDKYEDKTLGEKRSPFAVILVILGLLLSLFLVALDRTIISTARLCWPVGWDNQPCFQAATNAVRRPYLQSQTSSTPSTTTAGMGLPTC